MKEAKEQTLAEQNPLEQPLPLCGVCGALLPEHLAVCAVCGTRRGQAAPPTPFSEPAVPAEQKTSPGSFRRTRGFMGRVAALLALVLIVSAVGVGVYEYASYLNLLSRYTLDSAILYQQGGNMLKLSLDTIPQPFDLTDRFQSSSASLSAQSSHDSRFLAYLNNQRNFGKGTSGNLYLLDLLDLKPESTGESQGLLLTEEQVSDFRFLDGENGLLYLTTNGELYLAEYRPLTHWIGTRSVQKTTLLDNEVKGIGSVASDKVLYYKGEHADVTSFAQNQSQHSGSPFDLYTLQLNGRRQRPTLVGTNVYSVLDSSNNYEQIFYTRRSHNPPLVQYEIYRYTSGETGEEQLIADNVWHVVDANATKNRVVYLSPLQDMVRFEDLFDDDMAEVDAQNRATSNQVELTPFETLPTEEERVVQMEPEEEVFPVDTAEEAPPTDAQQPDQEMTPTEERQLRDKFRAHLRSSIRDAKQNSYLSFDLYEYSGITGEETRLAGPIYNWGSPEKLVQLDYSNDQLIYVESNPSQMTKQKTSELTSADLELYLEEPFGLLPFMAEHMPDGLHTYTLTTKEVKRLFSEPGSRYISNFYIPPTHDGVYFINYPSYSSRTGTLYLAPYAPTSAGDSALYQDDDVESIIGIRGGEFSGLIYQTASLDDPPQRNIYSISSTGIVEIALEVSEAEHIQLLGAEQQYVSYYRDYNPISKTGSWYLTDEQEENFISPDIASIASYGSDVLFAVRRESNSFRSLYEYREGEFSLLDERLGGYLFFSPLEE